MKLISFFQIETDQTTYYPGETIKGKIHLDVKYGFCRGDQLLLTIQGHEKSYWLEFLKSGYKDIRKEQKIYEHREVIHTFNSLLLPIGQYTFPFDFQLSPNIPGSIELNQPNYACEIQYKLIADITFHLFPKLRHSQKFFIKQQPINQQIEFLYQKKELQIQEWKCFNRGNSLFDFTIEKNFFKVGEICQVNVKIDNSSCLKNISRVYIQLINQINLRVENECFQNFERIAKKKDLYLIKVDLPIEANMQNETMFGTITGTLIQSSYFIRVLLEIPINCFQNIKPFIQLPIIILTQSQPLLPLKKIPTDWNPQVYINKQLYVRALYDQSLNISMENSDLPNIGDFQMRRVSQAAPIQLFEVEVHMENKDKEENDKMMEQSKAK